MKTHTLLQKQANPRPARLLTLLRRSGLAGFSPGLFAKRPSLRAAPVLRPPRRTAHPFPLPRRSASFFGAPCIHFRSRAHPQPLRGDIPRRSAFRTAAPCRSSCARTVSASAAPPVPAAGALFCYHRCGRAAPFRNARIAANNALNGFLPGSCGRATCFAPAASLPLCNTRAADHRFPLPMCTGGAPRKLLLPGAVFLPAAAVWQVFREAFLQKGRRSCAIPRFCNARVGFAPVQVVMPAY